MEKESIFNVLSKINVNDKTEKKNGLTYLSWAWAWGEVKKIYPTANYEVVLYDSKPFLFDEKLGYLVTTKVTIDNETIPMSLPVMDGANKAQKHIEYEYETKFGKKKVLPASMFDINTAIMRCLTKNLAMFGLGHYIYAGDDLPEGEAREKEHSEIPTINVTTGEITDLGNCQKCGAPLAIAKSTGNKYCSAKCFLKK